MRMGTRLYHYQRLYVTWQVSRYCSKDDHIYDDDNGDDSDDDNDNDQITLCRLFALFTLWTITWWSNSIYLHYISIVRTLIYLTTSSHPFLASGWRRGGSTIGIRVLYSI
jgi:hypothetical protein